MTNQERQILADLVTGFQTFGTYPKRTRVKCLKDNTALLKQYLNKFWGYLIQKMDEGGTGKERFIRTYHASKETRDKFLGEIQAIVYNGQLEYDADGNISDKVGNIYNDDGTEIGRKVGDGEQQLFSGISNTTIIIGALIIIGVILLLRRKPQIPVQNG